MIHPRIIINLHGVGPQHRPVDPGEDDCWLGTGFFEAILDVVRPHRDVQVTVDDGNSSDVELILPALLRRGISAVFFVCSDRLDTPTFLSRSQVRILQENGMAIGSHGTSHRAWPSLPQDVLDAELTRSRQELAAVCGRTITLAACPFGAYDRRVLSSLRCAGYTGVYTSDGGLVRKGDYVIPRTTIRRTMSIEAVRSIVTHAGGTWSDAFLRVKGILKRLR